MMITASMVKELREATGAGMMDCKKALEATNGVLEEAIDWLRENGLSKALKKASRIAADGLAYIIIEGDKAVIVEVNSETDFVAKNEEFQSLVSLIAKEILNNDVTNNEDVLALTTEEGTINELIVAKTATIGEKLSFRRFAKIEKKSNEVFGSYIHMGGRIASLILLEGANEEVAKDVSMHAAAMRPVCVTRDQVPSEDIEREREVIKEQAINEGKPADIAEKMVAGRIEKFYKEICLEEQEFVKDSDKTVGAFVKENNGSIKAMYRFEVGEGLQKRVECFAEEVMNQLNK
ncbi:MAG: translation elongation factor Ts [Bacilli bacterium]|nr:translation elongation factor Ts [Bacilli bacterium]MDD3304823.1 translation elongation factor Ts [Bacilli bacterium]MDD4053410.1 translation elongation factor Ts [Bacilli bacterium]MDD4410943.1 translation elongation factor Ts [Bacilli bacterium]